MKTLILPLQFRPGVSFEDAAAELCQMATKMDMICAAKFNGLELRASPHDSPLRLIEFYRGVGTARDPIALLPPPNAREGQ